MTFPQTERTKLKRLPKRGHFDAGAPVNDPRLPAEIPVPDYASHYKR